MRNLQKGFTLIELLVVITIIAIMAGVLFASFTGIQKRARDGKRKSDLRGLQHSLELIRADQGQYPDNSVIWNIGCGGTITINSIVYVQSKPCDPSNSSSYWNTGGYFYYNPTSGGGPTYTLGACLENASDTDPNDTGSSPSGSDTGCTTKWYYVLKNP